MAERIETDSTKNLLLNQADIENIDSAIFDYIEKLNIFCNTINGWTKVPIIWSSAERSFQIKNNRDLRDKNGSLIPPIISIDRTNITKDVNKKGSYQSNLSPKNDRITITKIINQSKTSNYANNQSFKTNNQINFITSKKNKKIVYQNYSVRIPVYFTIEYKINILTNYQMQMNEIVEPFIAKNAQNYFIITKNNRNYECFMDQNFQQDTLNLGEEERRYKTVITIKALGYSTGQGVNEDQREVNIIENPVDIKFTRESIIIESDGKSREISTQNVDSREDLTRTYKKTFLIGNGIDSSYLLNHNFGSRDVYISVRNISTNDIEFPGIRLTGLNDVSLDFGIVIGINSYSVTIIS